MIRILFLAANPADTSPLRLQDESRAIDLALRQTEFRHQFELQQHWAVRVSDLQSLLLRHQPHIVHFSGHGSNASEIILQDENGASHPVSEDELKQLFTLLKDNIRCVVLNACYSKTQAEALAEEIDCVIGMSDAIGDDAAIRFAAAFYQALGYGRDVKTAFGLGRLEIDLANLEHEDTPQLLAMRGDPAQIVFGGRVAEEPRPHPPGETQTSAPGRETAPPEKTPSKNVRPIPTAVWVAVIGGLATVLAALGPTLLGGLRQQPQPTVTSAVIEAAPPTATAAPPTATATSPPAATATPAIAALVRQSALTLEEVAIVRAYLAGPAPEEEKWDAVLALGKPGMRDLIPLLQEVIRDSRDTTTRHNAVQALGRIGPQAQAALLWALDLEPDNYILRVQVINTLGQLADDSGLAASRLRTILAQPLEDTLVLKSAIEVLGRLDAVEAVPEILLLLAGGPQVVRTQAAHTLGRFNLPEVKAGLRQAVQRDFVVETRVAAINSLVALQDVEAIPLFTQLQEGDEPPEIRSAAQDGLVRSAAWKREGSEEVVIVQPTPTAAQPGDALVLQQDATGIAQERLTVQLADSPGVTTTYEAGVRVRFVVASPFPDRPDLALVELPDGEQGWISVAAVAWSPSTANAGSAVLWPNGKVIKIAFLDGDPAVQEKVASYAQEWTEYANLTFDFGDYEDAEVRVSFEQPGSWSYIGANALSIPADQPTVNLGFLNNTTAEEMFKRTVLHEFGHVVGLNHEMQNPNHTIPWDREAIFDFYGGPPNSWSEETIEQNIFAVWAPGSYPVEKEFDRESIMMFPVPDNLTHGDYEIGWNNELSAGDKAFVALLYPKPPDPAADDAPDNADVSFTWFGAIDPAVVGIAGSAAEASAGYETSIDGQVHGAFSATFLRLLRDAQADVNRDGTVSLDEAVLATSLRLKTEGQPQSPLIVGSDRDFALFSLDPITPTAGVEPLPAGRPQRLEVLLVGINQYTAPSGISPLAGPVNDVRLFAELLADEAHVAAAQVMVTTLIDQEASAENILAALDALVAGADSSTAILFYFSGHNAAKASASSPNVREKALIPADASEEADYISVAEIARRLATSAARYKILIVDA